jgi:hypothetical protein
MWLVRLRRDFVANFILHDAGIESATQAMIPPPVGGESNWTRTVGVLLVNPANPHRLLLHGQPSLFMKPEVAFRLLVDFQKLDHMRPPQLVRRRRTF